MQDGSYINEEILIDGWHAARLGGSGGGGGRCDGECSPTPAPSQGGGI